MALGMMLVGRQTAAGQINLLGLPLSAFIAVKERAHIQWMGPGTAAGNLLYRRVNSKVFLFFTYILLMAMGLHILFL